MDHGIANDKKIVIIFKKLLDILELISTRTRILNWRILSKNSCLFSSVSDTQILRYKAKVNNNVFWSKHSLSVLSSRRWLFYE